MFYKWSGTRLDFDYVKPYLILFFFFQTYFFKNAMGLDFK